MWCAMTGEQSRPGGGDTVSPPQKLAGELRPYPEYKESKLPWMGKIPKHWTEERAKCFFREVDERSKTGDEELLSVSHVTGVTPRSQKNITMFKAESYAGYKLCKPHDLVINTMWAWMGALGVSKYSGIVSSGYGVYRPLDVHELVSEYVDSLLRTDPYRSEYYCRSTGIRSSRFRLYPEQFLRIPLVCPPHEEQEKMMAFLQMKDRQIKRYIHAKRQLIGVLNEQKQAIINHAVTRGIDPNVRLEPSGIEWLGDVPEHWKIKRLKNLVQNTNEQISTKDPDDLYIALENIESWTGRLIPTEGEIIFESQVRRFKPDDILFGKLRPYLAKVTRPAKKGVCVSELLVFRKKTNEISQSYLEQKLRSTQIIDLINSSTFGAKMPRADWGFIGNIAIAYPSSDEEQKKILDLITKQTAVLVEMINNARGEIDLIREYRTHLITDVVTGKVDVRNVEITEHEPVDEEVVKDVEHDDDDDYNNDNDNNDDERENDDDK